MGEPTQIEVANELLRAALDILTQASSGHYVKSVNECETRANGGGDGSCVREEIESYFDQYNVPTAFQWPEEVG